MITYDTILNRYELEIIDPVLGRETLLFETLEQAAKAESELV